LEKIKTDSGLNTVSSSNHVLKIPDFRNFLIGRALGVVAIQIQAVVVGWQVYSITKDPLSLGLVGLFEIIPSISVSLFAGHLSDLISRKKIILSAYFLLFLCSVSFFVLSAGLIPYLNLKVEPIYLTVFVSGLARGFLGASMIAFMAQLVPRDLYQKSSAWNGTAWQMAAVTGPFLGGYLYSLGFQISDAKSLNASWVNGASLAYLVDMILMIVSLSFIFRIQPKPVPKREQKEKFVDSLFMGFRYVFKHPILLGALSLDMFAVLFGGAVALLPIFAADILNVGPEGLGILRASPSVGAACMALFLAIKTPKENAGRILLTSVALFGGCIILFGISKSFYFSVFLLVLSGVFDSVSVIIRSTIVQMFTPDHMRGRVAAVNSIFIGSSNELGAFESGVTAKLMGTVPSVVFGGTMTLLVVGITSILSPNLRKLDFSKSEESET
jgi:MFS family permease